MTILPIKHNSHPANQPQHFICNLKFLFLVCMSVNMLKWMFFKWVFKFNLYKKLSYWHKKYRKHRLKHKKNRNTKEGDAININDTQ